MRQMKIMILVLVSLWTTACSDFLEEKSQDEVIPITTVDYSELLLGYLYSMESYQWTAMYMLDDDISISDRSMSPTQVGGDYNVRKAYGCFTWQPDMWEQSPSYPDIYDYTYSQIMGINAVLDGIDEAIGSQEDRDKIKAEALAARAFGYFVLVNLYGEPYNYNKKALGVPLKLDGILLENGIARSTVEEVYAQIVKDLEESSALFGKYQKQRGGYRINGTTADILLSRVYLFMEEYDKAIVAADRAIATAEGLTDYTKMTSDFILQTYNNSEVEWIYGDANIYFSLFQPSTDLLSKYEAGDKRKEFWMQNYYGIYILVSKIQPNGYKGPKNTIRISEAYLNRAEARVLSEKNANAAGALKDLNDVRRNRISNYQDIIDTEGLLDKIRTERRCELCFDWLRWFDLRRYGMPSISHECKLLKGDPWMIFTLREKDPLYTLPIPQTSIRNNVRLQQNASALEPEREGVLKN